MHSPATPDLLSRARAREQYLERIAAILADDSTPGHYQAAVELQAARLVRERLEQHVAAGVPRGYRHATEADRRVEWLTVAPGVEQAFVRLGGAR